MHAIIIEDEKPSARRLQRMLNGVGVFVETMLHSVEEAIVWFHEHEHPDLIFLDIQLSDGLSFEIFENIQIQSAIIFTTAYDEYALKAFKLNSLDYLLKPIDEDELRYAIDQYNARISVKPQVVLDVNAVKNLLINPQNSVFKKRFSVQVGQQLKLVNISNIECVFSENKGTYIFTVEGRGYLIPNPLDQLELELEPEQFFRINRKFIININAISSMVNYTNSRLEVRLNTYRENQLIVARERVKSFKEWLVN